VNIVGTWAGNSAPEGDAESLDKIRLSGAEIILIAYGMVKQDWWVARNLITSGASVAIGIGGVLDYKAGRVPLAPSWMRRAGFEWLYRLYKEPWRWRRQLVLPRFVLAVLKQRLNGEG
jgi:N-acetylglucosaminyldiphosphoundecaprenol N-acetyl-beta-D-mannosaminyltransferase